MANIGSANGFMELSHADVKGSLLLAAFVTCDVKSIKAHGKQWLPLGAADGYSSVFGNPHRPWVISWTAFQAVVVSVSLTWAIALVVFTAFSLQTWCNVFLQTKSSHCGQWGPRIPNIGPQP